MVDMSKETEQKIAQLQIMEQNLQNLIPEAKFSGAADGS